MLWPNGSTVEPRISGDNRDGEADFGPRKTGKGWHDGVDYGNYFRFVRAIDAGTVSRVQYWNGKTSMQHGNRVYVDHGGGVESSYSHLAWIDVKPWQRVEAGQSLGTMGATGFVTGVHLHLEIRVNGVLVDPRPFIRDRIGGAPAGIETKEWDEMATEDQIKSAVRAVVKEELRAIVALNKDGHSTVGSSVWNYKMSGGNPVAGETVPSETGGERLRQIRRSTYRARSIVSSTYDGVRALLGRVPEPAKPPVDTDGA